MEYKLNDMCDWERKKAIYLLSVADDLNMNLDCYGELAVNNNSNYTYLWLKDYNFSLYMPIDCELTKKDVRVLWTNSDDGEEREISLGDKDLNDIEKWIEEQEKSRED
jgi:hypothetical protein